MTKKQKTRKKINKLNLWALIVSGVAMLGLVCLIAGIIFLVVMLQGKPTLNVADFDQAESSIIYDNKGEEIASLGNVIRQNVEYEEMPNCVIDAFVAVEDSRYFEHNGFDIPRFTKAMIENIMSMSFEQGGSTFTMQLVKNTYFTNDDTGEQAARSGTRGIRRKVQEIALALELERYRSKQDIFESYVNKLNFGGSNNIRGIQKAAQYYFSKDITEVNLVEAALLAGVINAPYYYNPFYNLEAAQERIETVLYLMERHGYITKNEYELARQVRIEDLLVDPYSSSGEEGDGIPYQAYIDTVISELIDLTGLDPYTTTMHIYTYMNRDIQEQMDAIQAGNMDGYLEYPDEYFEVASVCIKNTTGEVVGVLGGRNYSRGGQLLLNHATDQYKQPGSSIKPILDYALAFENLGWATDHVLCDRPMFMDNTNTNLVYNDSGTYVGDVTLKQALGQSINTCAIQALQSVLNAKKYEYVVNYTQSLGYDFTLEDFNVQYAVGGSTCDVSPYQHAAAYTAIMNYGTYTTPHTIARIEFTNGKSPITPVYESKQVISEAAAFLTTELMHSNVQNYGGTYDYVKSSDYDVYAKTGTTDYGTSGSQFGIPSGAIKDGWLVACTSEYSTATWVGYEKAAVGQQSHINKDYYYSERPQGKIAHLILEAAYNYGDSKPKKLEKPSGVSTITHIIGTWPYAQFTDGMDESLRTTGYIKSDSVKLVALAKPTIEDIKGNMKVELTSDTGAITITWPKYPDETKLNEATDVKDISLKSSSGEVIVAAQGKCLFDYTMLYGPIKYMADITVSSGDKQHVTSSDNSKGLILDVSPGDTVHIEGYYGFESGNIISNKISKDEKVQLSFTVPNADTGREKLEKWASRYGFIEFEEVPTSDPNLVGTWQVTEAEGGSPIQPGTTIVVTSNDERYVCTYYVEVEHSLTISRTNSGDYKKVTLTATYDDSSEFEEWIYDEVEGLKFEINSHNALVITITSNEIDDQSITVTAKTNNKEAEITINIESAEFLRD